MDNSFVQSLRRYLKESSSAVNQSYLMTRKKPQEETAQKLKNLIENQPISASGCEFVQIVKKKKIF